jgi:DNA-binding protein Fis
MWSSCSREDRYLNDNWLLAATDDRDIVYGKIWMEKFGKEGKGNMIRDFASISAIQQILENGKTDWINFNGPPLIRFNIDRASNDINKKIITFEEIEKKWASLQKDLSLGKNVVDYYIEGEDVIDLYRGIFKKIKEPLLDIILKNPNRPNLGDKHPTPNEALAYLNINLPNSLNADEYAECWTTQIYKIKTKGMLPVEFIPNSAKRF